VVGSSMPMHARMKFATYFSVFSNWLAKWTGSHWAFSIAAAVVVVSLLVLGINRTNIAISVVSLLMLFILQNTQNRDSAALHLKLDEVITHLHGPRDKVAGIESKTEDEIEELKQAAPVE
jgi:low affinity Fe/Cu permease